uniref:Uncharacterized protein n=1 Tax=Lactuca sativa TaxID=4236 RepID=A0A9R1WAE5_LACSA|nr:hypothetical protein LSAT_V11C200069810 [Lactuca sativa]
MNEGPKCKFWEWLEPETPENEVNFRKDQKELCNITLKVSILENAINICKMKMEQENLVVRQEFKIFKWKLFTHKFLMIVEQDHPLELHLLELVPLVLDPLDLVPQYLLYKGVVNELDVAV